MPSPGHYLDDRDPMLKRAPGDISRKKSLVRPERRRADPETDPDYYYRKHAQHMNVMPSTTGRDPQLEEEVEMDSLSSEATTLKPSAGASPPPAQQQQQQQQAAIKGGVTVRESKRQPNKLSRKTTREARKEEKELRKQKIQDAAGTPSLWITYCYIITFWAPNVLLQCFGMKQREQQRAWREKMGLIGFIMTIMLFVGFLTFGFTETVCPAGGPTTLRVNHVGDSYMIFHGAAYDLSRSHHPLARGIPSGANVLYDLAVPEGGKDGSFLFQNVNGACKGLITLAAGSDVPTDRKSVV